MSGQAINPSFKGQEIQKREQNMTEVNWKSYFLGLCPSSDFLKKRVVLEASCVSIFKDPLDWFILNHWAPQKQ